MEDVNNKNLIYWFIDISNLYYLSNIAHMLILVCIQFLHY